MRWFGGFSGPGGPPRTPAAARAIVPGTPQLWMCGPQAPGEVRAAAAGDRTVAVIGACGITRAGLSRLADCGITDDVARQWPGSYIAVEITPAATTIWTDLAAAQPVYVTQAYGGLYWSTSSRALAGLTGASPDPDQVAARLLAPSVAALWDGHSSYAGISQVPAGQRATLPANGTPARWQRAWAPQPRPGNPATRLREELAAAVAVRADAASALTADLSGGYDSTSLALLAARNGTPVTGVTVHPAGHAGGGDLDYAREAAARSGITHRLMPLDGRHAPYSRLDAVPPTDEPAPSTIAHARFAGQLEWMRGTFGTDCHLTGDGGDSLLCSPPIMLADLITARDCRRARAETIRWARLRRLPARPLLRSARRTARASRPAALADLAASLRTGHPQPASDGDIGWYSRESVPAWATPQARERAAAVAGRAAARAVPAPPASFAVTAAAEAMAEVGRTARADIQLAEAAGVPLHNPFTDSRVIDAYLSVPLDQRPGPASYKPVLRDAMAGLFPPALAARTTKGDFNPDHYAGMRASLDALHRLSDGRLAALGLIDPASFRRTLTMAAAGLPVPFSAVEPAVAAETWLRAVADAPAIRWQPPERP